MEVELEWKWNLSGSGTQWKWNLSGSGTQWKWKRKWMWKTSNLINLKLAAKGHERDYFVLAICCHERTKVLFQKS